MSVEKIEALKQAFEHQRTLAKEGLEHARRQNN